MAGSGKDGEKQELVGSSAESIGCRRFITIEPVAFLFMSEYVMSSSMLQQYINYAVAESFGGEPEAMSESLCSMDVNETSIAEVQSIAADILSKFSLCNILPMLVAAVLMGSYSDARGRKVALLVPIVGGLLRGVLTLAVVFWNLDLRLLIGAALIEGLCGGMAVFSTAAFAYIADISKRTRRSWRMLVLVLMESLGIASSQVAMGYLVTAWGFAIPFLIIVIIYTLCLIYTACFIHETITTGFIQGGYFRIMHFFRTFRVLVNGADATRPWVMRCSSTILFVCFIYQGVISYSMTLYLTQSPLCFTWVMLGYHLAAAAISKAILGSLFHRVFHGIMGDIGLLIVAGCVGVLSKLWFAAPIFNVVYIYMECILAAPVVLLDPVARALMSKAAGADEQGAVQGLVAVLNVAGNLIGAPLASAVYSWTAGIYTGAVFVFGAALQAGIVGIALILQCAMRAAHSGNGEEESPAPPTPAPPTAEQ